MVLDCLRLTAIVITINVNKPHYDTLYTLSLHAEKEPRAPGAAQEGAAEQQKPRGRQPRPGIQSLRQLADQQESV